MRVVTLWRTRDGTYAVRDDQMRLLAEFWAEQDGWWRGELADGTVRRVWVPVREEDEEAAAREVTKRLLSR
ncbi:hypothetical protein [Actinomadura logoneensis]|nr:hypothetical protein [Actinomadura logoneensis]